MRWLVAIPLVLVGLLAIACGSDHAANDVVGPLFVYMDGAWRSDRLLVIVTYDLGAQKELFSFRPDGTSLSTEAVLDGDKVIVNQRRQLVQFDLDGTHPHVLYETPEGSEIVGIAVSPDTSKLAITEMTPYDPDAPQKWADLNSVTFLDLPSGKEILAVPQSDPRFGDFGGFVWKITWRDDGKGIVVQGNTESGRPGGTATVMLDGSVYGETYQDFVRVAPNGRYVEHGPEAGLPNDSAGKTQIVLSDLVSDDALASITNDGRVFVPYEWSPDNSEFLYASYSLTTQPCGEKEQCRALDQSSEQFYVLPVDGSAPQPVSDVDSLRRGWYGDRVIHYRCGDQWFAGPWCSGTQTASLYVGDILVADGNEFTPLGFVDR